MAQLSDEVVERTIRGLRFFSSSALAELTPSQLEEWAGASRQAIATLEYGALAASKLRELSIYTAELLKYYPWPGGVNAENARLTVAEAAALLDEAKGEAPPNVG